MLVQNVRRIGLGAGLSLLIAAAPAVDAHGSGAIPVYVTTAIADAARPAADVERDANRKPGEVLAFAGVKPGDRVADYAAGNGYFTRLFSGIVGPQGHVYASVPASLFQYENIVKGIADIQAYIVKHANVSVTAGSAIDVARYPEKLDLFWISQNYHDLHDPFMGPVDMKAFNRAVYAAL